MEYSTIISERVGEVALITLNRPNSLNALNQAMTDELEEAIIEARRDGVRTLMLTGAGRGFCCSFFRPKRTARSARAR